MALLDDYGKPEQNDKGEWVEIGHDEGRTVRLQIRAMPDDVLQSILRKHTRTDFVDNSTSGVRTAQPVPREWSDYTKFDIERAKFVLIDSENLFVRVRDAEAASFYQKAMGLPTPPPVEEEVQLDGKLTEAIKDHLLGKNRTFRAKVLSASEEITKRINAKIEVLEGNS